MGFKILFSDIDGTCVHYTDGEDWVISQSDDPDQGTLVLAKWGTNENDIDIAQWSSALLLPPSTSGSRGIISRRTIDLYAAIRALGIKIVLISGCRYTTFLQRLAFLPAADAYVCESGGRIFYPDSTGNTAAALKEDLAWRDTHNAAGPPYFEHQPIESRMEAVLWQQYQMLNSAGLRLDARNYTTAFRVKVKREEWQEKFAGELLPGLSSAENLGAVDIYPATSGKLNSALYLMETFGAAKDGKDSVFMCGKSSRIFMFIPCINVLNRGREPTPLKDPNG